MQQATWLSAGAVCHDMDAELFKKSIAPMLRANGFKRTGATWRNAQAESIAVLSVHKSRWGSGDFAVNLGIYFRALGNDASPTDNRCHVQFRLYPDEPSAVVAMALTWFRDRADLRKAAKLEASEAAKGLVYKEVRAADAT